MGETVEAILGLIACWMIVGICGGLYIDTEKDYSIGQWIFLIIMILPWCVIIGLLMFIKWLFWDKLLGSI